MLTLKRLGYQAFATLFLLLVFLKPKETAAQDTTLQAAAPAFSLEKDTCQSTQLNANLALQLSTALEMPEEPEIKLSRQAEIYVANYLKKNDADLQKIQSRSKNYFKTIDAVFSTNGLPVALKYLAVIESELKTSAVSHAGAAGLWQLMPQTARYLGLKVTARNDERKTLVKSTKAAAKYIKALYAQFDDWLLVVAAYNSGAGPVYTAIKKAGSRDFWSLQRFLPAETRNHVKRYIGAHYFFEGEGSLTTLTKSESLKHAKKVAEYQQKLQVLNQLEEPVIVSDEVLLHPKR